MFSKSVTNILIKKYLRRGQITFNSHEKFLFFKTVLDAYDIPYFQMKLSEKHFAFSHVLFFPHYLENNNESAETCFSFN